MGTAGTAVRPVQPPRSPIVAPAMSRPCIDAEKSTRSQGTDYIKTVSRPAKTTVGHRTWTTKLGHGRGTPFAVTVIIAALLLVSFTAKWCQQQNLAGKRLFSLPPSEVPYYGRSPPVYPSPSGNGSSSSAWARAYGKACALVDQMTLEEKVNLTHGWPGRCAGNSGTVPRLGVPSLCYADAPDGVRGQEFVPAFPAGIHLASTFDADLMYRYGKAVGSEFYGRGVHVALGPVAGPLGRIARGGRNWEGLSNDPYLAGVGLGAITRGMQEAGVIATPKHFLLNEQEFRRRETARQPTPGIVGEAVSTNVDDRTLHELYVFPFMDALAAGAAAIMCSYQRANHSYGCQNSKLLNGVLKTELGFEGFVVSDWDGQHSGVASALAGLDVAMPGSDGFWAGGLLATAVTNGSVAVERIDDMATRILASRSYIEEIGENGLGQMLLTGLPFPIPPAIYASTERHPPVDVQAGHAALIRTIGAAGTVLVKNVNHTLPLGRPRFLCVYGYDAVVKAGPWDDPARFGGGYNVNGGWNTLNGTLITGGGSGGSTPPYVVSPFQALQERVVAEGGVLRWDFHAEAPPVIYANADACLVFINAYASEIFDRPSLTDQFSDQLVLNVASSCANTIVVVHSAGIRVVDAWIDHVNVTAVLFAGLPGQESGHSLTDVLYGDVNPSGRLPYTVARRESDYGALLSPCLSTEYYPDDDFSEGLYIDYRAFDRRGIEPRFPFGFGLSYTTFDYGPELTVDVVGAKEKETETETTSNSTIPAFPDPDVPVVQGGHPDLWQTVAVVRSRIANSGETAGTEVVQLYVGVPGADGAITAGDSPVRQLRGFRRVGPLAAGQEAIVEFVLTRRDLSVWDAAAQQWRLRQGTYQLYVGASSRDLRVNGTLLI
ncbi:beta-glucosidase [Grosmannia clavigera kw1407]|uniref:Beta-glucosidase cel3A n=1 Tax=Grosmannia clavigera (strain kw1407 / UAMH 11150) TaxID=655863 RepID=F0XP56_GROCL|nr:beta-glucosidase [Grosmannia clavigera kw1407]EFX00050.1 beta-glucosidase [Grosmannia clavigera kw1407]